MVLPMISKVIAGQKREPHGIGVGASIMPIRESGIKPPVWQVGAKSEKLERTEESGQRPKSERIPLGSSKKNLHRNSNRKDSGELLPAEIMHEEMKVPAQITRATLGMKIRVVPWKAGRGVMPVVLTQKMGPIKTGIEKHTEPPHPSIEPWPTRCHHSMHGIMSRDEQAGIEESQN